ncbi:hypothetical protein SKAU_G00382630 [Synaphobranchus kaupii]|uniref:Uncharacterized protein n=1 Tax=Synaphobranchus kaupii TaxID=118154 RepID=A0A9Q1EDZ9_SYNKA|nr:hypothetical protein SKAU_G00382630 [Synaphobranchus kaupii]
MPAFFPSPFDRSWSDSCRDHLNGRGAKIKKRGTSPLSVPRVHVTFERLKVAVSAGNAPSTARTAEKRRGVLCERSGRNSRVLRRVSLNARTPPAPVPEVTFPKSLFRAALVCLAHHHHQRGCAGGQEMELKELHPHTIALVQPYTPTLLLPGT